MRNPLTYSSSHRTRHHVTFANSDEFGGHGDNDVGGVRKHLAQVRELVDHPKLLQTLGVNPPVRPRILLYGSPCTGKTLLARHRLGSGDYFVLAVGPEIMSKMAAEREANLRRVLFMDEVEAWSAA
jgi:ATP-dependent 26S proteasome regulatory subunit